MKSASRDHRRHPLGSDRCESAFGLCERPMRVTTVDDRRRLFFFDLFSTSSNFSIKCLGPDAFPMQTNVFMFVFFCPKLYFFKIDRFRIFLEGPFALWCFTGYELKEVNARHPSETAMFLKSCRNCHTKTMILISFFFDVI